MKTRIAPKSQMGAGSGLTSRPASLGVEPGPMMFPIQRKTRTMAATMATTTMRLFSAYSTASETVQPVTSGSLKVEESSVGYAWLFAGGGVGFRRVVRGRFVGVVRVVVERAGGLVRRREGV
ncbi:MAG: hypothetical protein KIT19_09300 [Phycisphaeraceae bacterium]|nr:hypothetical protein [Phycisphaeraceae bacterium]